MKKNILIFILLFGFILNVKSQSQFSISVGEPISKIPSNKISLETSLNRKFFNNIFFGFGYKYLKLDILPTNHLITFDRKINNCFITTIYKFKIISKLNADFEIQSGYSWLKYNINEFDTPQQTMQSFSVSPVLTLNYKIFNLLNFGFYISYNQLFKKFNNNIDFPIPASYFPSSQKNINYKEIGFKLFINIKR
jgi:hypothetical protein